MDDMKIARSPRISKFHKRNDTIESGVSSAWYLDSIRERNACDSESKLDTHAMRATDISSHTILLSVRSAGMRVLDPSLVSSLCRTLQVEGIHNGNHATACVCVTQKPLNLLHVRPTFSPGQVTRPCRADRLLFSSNSRLDRLDRRTAAIFVSTRSSHPGST
ncbi:hypothetical protein G5I_12071 [Acromyrmex echinatior]|uniref:Uncharacterized protein n=1 Tax=Acromyrmex echinatior TaxID=103372 RepID=F4X1B2_ACREC|nr:hypothetical protein G5I_12071 [Acromyrmex echinatior]